MIVFTQWKVETEPFERKVPSIYPAVCKIQFNENGAEVLKSPSLVIIGTTGEHSDVAILAADGDDLNAPPTAEQLAGIEAWLESRGYSEQDTADLIALTQNRTRQQIINDIGLWMVTP